MQFASNTTAIRLKRTRDGNPRGTTANIGATKVYQDENTNPGVSAKSAALQPSKKKTNTKISKPTTLSKTSVKQITNKRAPLRDISNNDTKKELPKRLPLKPTTSLKNIVSGKAQREIAVEDEETTKISKQRGSFNKITSKHVEKSVDLMEIDDSIDSFEKDKNTHDISAIVEEDDETIDVQLEDDEEITDDDIIDIDYPFVDDPIMCTEYVNDIHDYLRQQEVKYAVDPAHVSRQFDFNAKHRAILVDWLAAVSSKFRLQIDTFLLTVQILDRVLEKKSFPRTKLQLVGVTALFIAVKYEEIHIVTLEDLVYITRQTYTQDQILNMEQQILVTLDFELGSPTCINFLRRFSMAANFATEQHTMSKYLIETSCLDVEMLQFPPSLIASSSIYLTRKILKLDSLWNKTLEHYTKYTIQDMQACAERLTKILSLQFKNDTLYGSQVSLDTIKQKYSSKQQYQVALVQPC